jgi:hypothetical protein
VMVLAEFALLAWTDFAYYQMLQSYPVEGCQFASEISKAIHFSRSGIRLAFSGKLQINVI